MTGKDIQRWADPAMFHAEPMQVERTEDGGIIPQVRLLTMTPDPLGAIAAMARMYKGIPTYDLAGITDEERRQYFADVQATHLRAPLEAVKLHFQIEGVTRSFTHQMVRQRTAVYAQESLRFAVKDEEAWTDICSLPPSLAGTRPASDFPTLSDYEKLQPHEQRAQSMRSSWDRALYRMEHVYKELVEMGMPAEDARGLMPHAMTTRINYVTDLRNLVDHAGNRLCTQAQFEWRLVLIGIVNAIRQFGDGFGANDWQFQAIADSALFRPVCYQLGHCPFKASFDRECKIRDRVDSYAAEGIPSSEWGNVSRAGGGIKQAEWLLDPAAARNTSGGAGHE